MAAGMFTSQLPFSRWFSRRKRTPLSMAFLTWSTRASFFWVWARATLVADGHQELARRCPLVRSASDPPRRTARPSAVTTIRFMGPLPLENCTNPKVHLLLWTGRGHVPRGISIVRGKAADLSRCQSSGRQAADLVENLAFQHGFQIDQGLSGGGAVQNAMVEGQAHIQRAGGVEHAVVNGRGKDGNDSLDAGTDASGR